MPIAYQIPGATVEPLRRVLFFPKERTRGSPSFEERAFPDLLRGMESGFRVKTLKHALKKPLPAILNADRGTQFTREEFTGAPCTPGSHAISASTTTRLHTAARRTGHRQVVTTRRNHREVLAPLPHMH